MDLRLVREIRSYQIKALIAFGLEIYLEITRINFFFLYYPQLIWNLYSMYIPYLAKKKVISVIVI